LKTLDLGANLENFSCDVISNDEGILEPWKHPFASDLLESVNRINGDGAVANDDLVRPRSGIRCIFDLER
jgi:hypothetical protein